MRDERFKYLLDTYPNLTMKEKDELLKELVTWTRLRLSD